MPLLRYKRLTVNGRAQIFAIVPAAGRSERMGTLKQTLAVDGRPMVLGVVEALLGGGASGVVVVVNSRVRQQLASLPEGAVLAVNDDRETEMIDSIRIGLNTAPAAEGYLVCPCDAAGIRAADVQRCVDAFSRAADHIIIASHKGKRGHPMIFPNSFVDVIRSSECDAGLNQLARMRPQLVQLVECDSVGTIANLNTPEDYEGLSPPSPREGRGQG
jgi:molybdenum cofactor cytidylyltransferase